MLNIFLKFLSEINKRNNEKIQIKKGVLSKVIKIPTAKKLSEIGIKIMLILDFFLSLK